MKNYFILTALLCCFYSAHAQSPLKTINYQAMIVDPAVVELPGGAIQAQLYLNKSGWIRFGIYAGETLQFEELHKTKTDEHGLINLEIGNGESTSRSGAFSDILWGGLVNRLKTDVSFNAGAQFVDVSNQTLSYLPYAFFAQEAGKLSGVLPLIAGGTGAITAEASRQNLGLGKVDNTSDVDKPVSGLVLAELNTKETSGNKSLSILIDSASNTKYPTVKAVKEYIDSVLPKEAVTNQASSANLAAKATVLETARTINGVPFDGSENITISTVSSAVTATTALTALTANTASTALSATYAFTASTLTAPQTIFGYPFDGSAAISGILSPTYGGTGVDNGNKTITLGGDLVTSGNFSTTIITVGNTSISLPTSGTLATLAGTETLTNKTFVNSSLSGTLTLGGPTFPSSRVRC